ncbi:MAG: hypothetical protein H6600_04125 [Flavobacteriales bacterium]|nr:hypothetical protein [Flavobacteriales bacterium]MCB9197621.1 hypothetical protein [Flavobacteriales bacterium]
MEFTLGDILVLLFVGFLFTFGIYGGLRLYRWNMKDRAEIEKKNAEKKKNDQIS